MSDLHIKRAIDNNDIDTSFILVGSGFQVNSTRKCGQTELSSGVLACSNNKVLIRPC